jgi:hypothetical protein
VAAFTGLGTKLEKEVKRKSGSFKEIKPDPSTYTKENVDAV